MNTFFSKIQTVKEINPNEFEQAVIRFVFVSFLLAFLLINKFFFGTEVSPFQINLCAFYLIANLCLTTHIFKYPALNIVRVSITMFVDILMTSIELAISGAIGSILIGIYLWLVIGYGIRYKGKMLLSSHITAILGFTIAITFNPYWLEHIYLAYGMALTLLLVPIHTKQLLGKLDAALYAAKTANKAKTDFLSHISHELRTPLNGVIGASKLLEHTKLNKEQTEYVNIVQDSSKQLYMLISDVLDLAKIESGKREIKATSFNLATLITEIDSMFHSLAVAKGLSFSMQYTNTEHLNDTFISDPLMIKQIIINLVGNAVKFTEKGFIKLNVEVSDEHLKVSVQDSGIGIAADKLPLVFGRFNQVHDTAINGTGLGTSISKQLVTLLDGSIDVSSQLNSGSTFFFDIPIKPSATTKTLETAHQKVRKLNILIADDSATNLLILSRILEKEHHHVFQAKDGEEALDVLETEHVDLMLLDINMPKHTGIEVVQLHSAIQGGLDLVPTIMLSADANTHTIEKCKGIGIDHYLTKPIDKTLLLNTIASIAEKSKPQSTVVNFEKFKTKKTKQESHLNLDTLGQLLLLDNDDNFLNNLINDYIHNAEISLSELSNAVERKDFQAINSAAHNLIGASLGLGCDTLADKIRYFDTVNPGASVKTMTTKLDQAKVSFVAAKQALLAYSLAEKTVT